jgi:hypothetical protein
MADGDTLCMNGAQVAWYPHTSQQGKPWMLLVRPKLLYFGIVGHFCALALFHEPSTGKGPCE